MSFVNRPLRRLAVVLAGLAFLLAFVVSTASAHASVIGTTPGDGSVLQTRPASVSVVFDQPVETGFGTLRVFAPDGSRVDVGDAVHPPGRADTVTVRIGPPGADGPARGTYTVAWRVVSADSHPVTGGFTFSIGTPSAVTVRPAVLAPNGSRMVGVVFGAARWSAYAGFALLVGGGVFVAVCWPGGFWNRRMRRLLAAAWTVLLLGTAASLLSQGPYAAGVGYGRALSTLGTTMGTRLGEALAARLVLLVLLLLAIPLRSRIPRRSAVGLGALAVPVLAVTWTVADHGGTGSQVPIAAPADVLHLTAMAVWLGGLAALAGVLLPTGDGEAIAVAVPRFSALAFGGVVVLAVTGAYQGWRAVGTVPALTATDYGRLLLGKIAGFCLLIGLGAAARRWIGRHLATGSAWPTWRRPAGAPAAAPSADDISALRASVAMEVAVGVSVLALTAVLVAAQPARAAYDPPVRAASGFDAGGPAGRGTVRLAVDPARVGYNTIHLDVLDAGRQPVRLPEVDAAFLLPAAALGPLPVQLIDTGAGHYLAMTPVALAGAWQLRVTVRTDDIDETTVTFPVKVR